MGGSHAHHGHSHGVGKGSAAALLTAFLINLLFSAVELVGGLWTGSVAVLTDAVHDAGDSIVLGAAWYLQVLATKDRDSRYSYGYGRYSMLGGWFTSLVLIAGAMFMFAVSVPRLWEPVLPNAKGMVLLAIFGVVMNGYAAWRLHRGSSLNERGAYLHLMEDVLGWVAVMVGAVVIHFTGWAIIDPLLSMAIGVYILVNAYGTLRKGTAILMQQVPQEVDMTTVDDALLTIPGVLGIHDQHTWSLDGNYTVLTAHLVVDSAGSQHHASIKQQARQKLSELGIHHATLELESEAEECALSHM